MRFLATLSMAAAALFSSQLPAAAQLTDEEAIYSDKPLMIVRYNKPRVYMSKALDRAIGSAEKVKADMIYKVVAYIPETTPIRVSRARLRSVVEGIQMNGVPVERIQWQTESTSGRYPEIHLYVE